MATHIGIGFSRNSNVERAAQEAAFQSKTQLNQNRIDFAVVLSTIHYDPKRSLPVIQRVLNNTQTIGCSSAGIILAHSIETQGIAILTVTSDEITSGFGFIDSLNAQDVLEAGRTFAQETITDFGKHGRQVFIFFVDGYLESNSLLLKGIQEVLGNVFPIIGAGSCDDFHFKSNFQILQKNISRHSAVGLMLGGHLSVGVSGRHGWRPLGKPRLVNKSNRNIIKMINGKRASSIYEEYFDLQREDLRSMQLDQKAILYPLGIYVEGSSEYLLRNVAEVLSDGSIVCQGDVPEGSIIHIMIGNKESCKQAAGEAAHEAQLNLLGKLPTLVVVIESMARLKLLGRSASNEIQQVKDVFGPDVPILGMYSYGEICPFQSFESIKKPYLQNESIVVLALC